LPLGREDAGVVRNVEDQEGQQTMAIEIEDRLGTANVLVSE
jgi:hypothetical protein